MKRKDRKVGKGSGVAPEAIVGRREVSQGRIEKPGMNSALREETPFSRETPVMAEKNEPAALTASLIREMTEKVAKRLGGESYVSPFGEPQPVRMHEWKAVYPGKLVPRLEKLPSMPTLCGVEVYDEETGETMVCGKLKGHGIVHGNWRKA